MQVAGLKDIPEWMVLSSSICSHSPGQMFHLYIYIYFNPLILYRMDDYTYICITVKLIEAQKREYEALTNQNPCDYSSVFFPW